MSNSVKAEKQLSGANQRFWSLAVERGYDLERMAEAIECSYSLVSKLKDGWRPITKNVAVRIRKNLGINEDWLLYNKGPKEAVKGKEVAPKALISTEVDSKDMLKMYMDMSDRLKAIERRVTNEFKINMPGYDSPKINVDNPSQAELSVLFNLTVQRIYKLESLIEIAITNKRK